MGESVACYKCNLGLGREGQKTPRGFATEQKQKQNTWANSFIFFPISNLLPQSGLSNNTGACGVSPGQGGREL